MISGNFPDLTFDLSIFFMLIFRIMDLSYNLFQANSLPPASNGDMKGGSVLLVNGGRPDLQPVNITPKELSHSKCIEKAKNK